MNDKFRNFLIKLLFKIHFRLFKHEMGETMKAFIKNLAYTTASTFFVAGVMMILQIVAGRYLGPTEYGKYSLIESVGGILFLFCLLGLNVSAIYHIAKEKRKKQLLTASLVASVLNTIIVTITCIFLLYPLSHILKIDQKIIIYGILFMIFYAYQEMSRAFLKGLVLFKKYALFDIMSSIISLLVFFILIIFHPMKTFSLMAYGKFSYFTIFSLFTYLIIFPYFSRFNFKDLKKLYGYGLFVFGGSLAVLIYSNGNRILLNYFRGPEMVGLYYAYFIASEAIILQSLQALLTILFPTVTKVDDKKELLAKINKLIPAIAPFILFVNIVIITAIVWLFGKDYPLKLSLVALFSLNTLFSVIYQIYACFVGATGKSGAKRNAILSIFGAIIFIILAIILIPRYGIIGAISSLIFTNLFLAISFIVQSKLFIKIKNN